MPDLSDAFVSTPAPSVVTPIATPPVVTPPVPDDTTAKPAAKPDISEAFAPLPTQSGYVSAGGQREYGDYLTAMGTGMHELGAATMGALGSVTSDETRKQFDWYAQQEAKKAQESRQTMTPAAQQGGIGITLAEQVPSFAALGAAEMVGGPLAAGGLMAAQSRGELETRGAQQGYQPTQAELAVPTVTGFLAGALPGANLPGKIAVSRPAQYALGLGTGTATFGIQAATEEAAGQQVDISAGTRKAYDPSQIIGAGVSGAEFGGAFSAFHIPRRGEPVIQEAPAARQVDLSHPQTGGEATPVRSDREGRKPDAAPGPGGKPSPVKASEEVTPGVTITPIGDEPYATVEPKATGPLPPANPVADPDIKVAAPGNAAIPSAEAGNIPGAPKAAADAVKAAQAAAPKVTPRVTRVDPSDEQMQQHAEVLNPEHPRDVVLFPPDVKPPVLSSAERQERYGSSKLPDGSTLIYDRKAGTGITKGEIAKQKSKGTLDQYVQDALKASEDRVNAPPEPAPAPVTPETPVATPVTTPPAVEAPRTVFKGVPAPVQEGEATPLPARAETPSAASLEAPGGIRPEVVSEPAPQLTGVVVPAGAAEEAAKPPVTPQVTPGVTGRVLEAAPVTEHERALTKQEELKAKQRAKVAAKAAAKAQKIAEAGDTVKIGGKNWTKKELAKIEENNRKAQEVVDRHPPVEGETLDDRRARAERMLKDAKAEGVKIPSEFGKGTLHGPGAMLLDEARELTKNKLSTIGQHTRFFDKEHMLREGKVEEAAGVRVAEGARGMGSPEGATEVGRAEAEHEVSPEEELIRKQEEEREPHDEWSVSAEAPREDILKKIEAAKAIARDPGIGEAERANALRGVDRLQAALQGRGRERPTITEAREGEHYTAVAERKAPVVVAMKRRGKVLRQELEGEEGEHPLVTTTGADSFPTEVRPIRTSDLGNELRIQFRERDYPSELRSMMPRLVEQIMKIAKDVPVHYISDDELARVAGAKSGGMYDPNEHHILVNHEFPSPQTVLHEGMHAATAIAIEGDKHLKRAIDDLRLEVQKAVEGREDLPEIVKYALRDPHEFLTGMMTEPKVQQALKDIKISRELADRLFVPKWRKATMWEGALGIIRKALGLGPRDTSAIEAAMSLADYAFYKHLPEEGMEFMERFAKADVAERMKPLAQRTFNPAARHVAEEQAEGNYKDYGKQIVKDGWENIGGKFQKHLPKLMNGVQLARYYGNKLFRDEKGNIIHDLAEVSRKMGVELNKLRDADFETYKRSVINAVKYPDRQGDYQNLWEMTNNYNVDASKAPEKPMKNPEKAAMDKHQGNKYHSEMHELYNSLPEELQKQYKDEMQFFRDKRKTMANQQIDLILDHIGLPAGVTDRADLKKRMFAGDMNDDETEHYHNLDVLDKIREARTLMNETKNYAPAYRSGNFVVKGRYAMPDGGYDTDVGGEALPDNTRQFDTQKELHDYVTSTRLHAASDKVYYDKNTGEKLVTALQREEARDRGDLVERYETKVQREHMEMHQTKAQARAALDYMRDKLKLEELSGVLDRSNENDWGRINSGHANAMEARINRSDLSGPEKKAAIKAMRDYELVTGSAYQSHLVTRRFVGGADYGHAEGIRSYSEAVNRQLVNNKFRMERDNVMQRAEAKDKENRKGDQSYQSSAVMNELRDRMYRDPDEMSYKTAPWINRLMAVSYMKYMFGPRHMLMLQTHPMVYSAPEMAGRHGMPESVRAIHQAFSDLGGGLYGMKEGLKATGRAVKSLRPGLDPEEAAALSKSPDIVQNMLAQKGVKDYEREDMLKNIDTGHFHSGYTDEAYTATGFDKIDAIMRQQSRAQDSQNRVGVGLAAYRLEYERTGSRAKALAYSRSIIEKTIGVHSSFDMGSAMKNPFIRSFMQYKHFPLRQTELMMQNVYHAFKNEDPEIRREAMKAAIYQVGSSFATAGVHGLPIALLKPIAIVGSALGITPTPTQIEDRSRRMLAGLFGADTANAIIDGGLSIIPHMPNTNNMFSRDFDPAFGEPKHGDLMSFLLNDLGGAPVSVVGDSVSALKYLLQGDGTKALQYAPLPRTLGDIARAQGLMDHGATTTTGKPLTPASNLDAVARAFGFSTYQEMRIQSGRAAAQQDIQELPPAKKNVSEQLKDKQKATIMGIAPSKRTKQLLEERQEVYQ